MNSDLIYNQWLEVATHYRTNSPEALFEIGQLVTIHADNAQKLPINFVGGRVLGLRWNDFGNETGEFEYAVNGAGALLFEHELYGVKHVVIT